MAKNPQPSIDADLVRRRLDYTPETGVFYWRSRSLLEFPTPRAGKVWNTRYAGQVAGCRRTSANNKHYWVIRLNGRVWPAHQLAYVYMAGFLPETEVDHANGDGLDNRWDNLRLATHFQNMANTALRSHSRNPYKGVSKVNARYRAKIVANNQMHHLGYFDTPEDAARAYNRAAREYFGEYACLNNVPEPEEV